MSREGALVGSAADRPTADTDLGRGHRAVPGKRATADDRFGRSCRSGSCDRVGDDWMAGSARLAAGFESPPRVSRLANGRCATSTRARPAFVLARISDPSTLRNRLCPGPVAQRLRPSTVRIVSYVVATRSRPLTLTGRARLRMAEMIRVAPSWRAGSGQIVFRSARRS